MSKFFVPKDPRFLNRWSQVQLLFRAPPLNSKHHFPFFLTDVSLRVIFNSNSGKILEFFSVASGFNTFTGFMVLKSTNQVF